MAPLLLWATALKLSVFSSDGPPANPLHEHDTRRPFHKAHADHFAFVVTSTHTKSSGDRSK